MNFKFFKGNDENLFRFTGNNLTFRNENNVEFCFQFDDDEPTVFGRGPNDLQINVPPTANGNITFNSNGKVFKIFAREIDV